MKLSFELSEWEISTLYTIFDEIADVLELPQVIRDLAANFDEDNVDVVFYRSSPQALLTKPTAMSFKCYCHFEIGDEAIKNMTFYLEFPENTTLKLEAHYNSINSIIIVKLERNAATELLAKYLDILFEGVKRILKHDEIVYKEVKS